MKGPNAAKGKMPGTNCLAYGAIAFKMNLSLNGIFVVLNLNIHCSILFLHGDRKKRSSRARESIITEFDNLANPIVCQVSSQFAI
jgi:hypothetical protein